MNYFILSQETQKDIEAIYSYGSQIFGENKALNYLIELRSYFQLLSDNPHLGKERNEIKEGLYSFPYESHIIFYRILKTHLRIVRVLHGSRDLRKFIE